MQSMCYFAMQELINLASYFIDKVTYLHGLADAVFVLSAVEVFLDGREVQSMDELLLSWEVDLNDGELV